MPQMLHQLLMLLNDFLSIRLVGDLARGLLVVFSALFLLWGLVGLVSQGSRALEQSGRRVFELHLFDGVTICVYSFQRLFELLV